VPSPIRDVYIGRLKVVTYDDTFQEAVGDELQLQGGVAALGARKPKRYAMSLPIHASPQDANLYAASQRLRRQVRSLLENAQARSQGFYMRAYLDPEQNGWLVIGSGTIAYGEGGVTLGDYELTLDEVYRVASARAYRPARRLDLYDRRLSTTPRDFLGTRYSTDYAQLTAGSYGALQYLAWLPPNVQDLSGLARAYVSAFPAFSREGYLSAVQGQQYGTVLSFEQIETKRQAADVVIYDRQGAGDFVPPYTNFVTNPSFEQGLAGYLTDGLVTLQTSGGYVGANFARVIYPSATTDNALISAPLFTSVVGQSYTVSAFVRPQTASTGTVTLRDGTGRQILQNLAGLTVGAWSLVSFSFTETTAQSILFQLTVSVPYSTTIDIDAISITNTAAPVGYFDGSSPGYGWTGAPGASASQGPGGWVNAGRNPSFESGTTDWVLISGSGVPPVLTVKTVADDPLSATGSSADVSFSGVASSGFQSSTLASCMYVAPGQTVWCEAWVKLIAPLPAGAVLNILPLVLLNGAAVALPSGAVATATATAASPTGTWIRLYGLYTIPAGLTQAGFIIATAFHPTTATIHYRVDNTLICDASALGTPPTYNPPNYPNTTYFDGNSSESGWTGAVELSQSVRWIDPQLNPGWEEVYGLEHPLTLSDVPVLSNSVARVRMEVGAVAAMTFAIDTATSVAAGSGGLWTEQGRVGLTVNGQVVTTANLGTPSVAEWTPERAVVRVPLYGLASARADLYISMQRGWSGPRFELYTSASYVWSYTPNDPAPNYAALTTSAILNGSGADSPGLAENIPSTQLFGGLSSPSTYDENWFALSSTSGQPNTYLILDQDGYYGGWFIPSSTQSVYPTPKNTLALNPPYTPNGYGSLQLAYPLSYPVGSVEAETIVVTGGTAATATAAALADPAATPTITTSASGGNLPSNTYYYVYTACNATGESNASPLGSVTTGTGSANSNTVTVAAVAGATYYRIYRYYTDSAYHLVGTTTTTSFVDSVYSITGASAVSPLQNTTGPALVSGGQFVTETQTSFANNTLRWSRQQAVNGTYALWLRIRLFGGDSATIQWDTAATNIPGTAVHQRSVQASGALSPTPAVTVVSTASASWLWVYCGEIVNPAGLTVAVQLNRNARASQGNVAIDVAALVKTVDPATFDGARDQGAQALVDTRPVPEVVQR
jgi:hypothetical protein